MISIRVTAAIALLSLPCHAAQNAWSRILTLPDVTPSAPPVQILSDYRLGRVYVLTERANFYRTADRGQTWTAAPGRNDPHGGSSTLALDPIDSNTIYRSTTQGVFKSTDGGATWQRIDSGFAYSSFALTVAPHPPHTVYVSVSASCGYNACNPGGIMKSYDGGASWSKAGLDPALSFNRWRQHLDDDST